jgi:hypothetical protein
MTTALVCGVPRGVVFAKARLAVLRLMTKSYFVASTIGRFYPSKALASRFISKSPEASMGRMPSPSRRGSSGISGR